MRLLSAFLVIASHAVVWAADDTVVDDDAFIAKATESAKALHENGKLVGLAKLRSQLGRTRVALEMLPPRNEKLPPREIHRLLRKSTVVVATFYHCEDCKDWHIDTATGFVAAEDVVSTCEHVVDFEDEELKDGFLVVIGSDATAHAVTEVLAANATADTCLLRVAGLGLAPLPLNPDAQVGDRLYCLSHPDGNHWMFTEGMLSRFFISREAGSGNGNGQARPVSKPSLYINVTTEFSPGSSGAPVVDEFGNVVGQVESITSSLEKEEAEKGATVTTSFGMPLRSCISAREIASLFKRPAKAGRRKR